MYSNTMDLLEIKSENCLLEPNSGSESNSPHFSLDDYKSKIIRGIIRLKEKQGRSRVWNIFASMLDENGEEIDGFVACRSCFKIFKYQKCTSNLIRHKCFTNYESKDNASENIQEVEVDKETKSKFTDAATHWLIANCRPPSILEDTGLKNMAWIILSIGATYGDKVNVDRLLPKSKAIERNLSYLYGIRCQQISADINKIKHNGYSITVYVWTDSVLRRSLMSVTIHYIMQATMVNHLLAISPLNVDSNIANAIRENVTACMNKFDCDLDTDNPFIVTIRKDNFADVFKRHHHINCTNNLLCNTIQQIFKIVPELQQLLDKCIELVQNLRSSSGALNLPSYSSSGNSILYYLQTVQDNWQDVSKILLDKTENSLQITDIKALVNILVSIEETSQALIDENMPTLHIIIPHLHKLHKLCLIENSKSTKTAVFKTQVKTRLDSIRKEHVTKYHKIALFLFPPTKKLLLFDEVEKEHTIEACKSMMQQYYVENQSPNRKRVKLSTEFCGDSIFSDFLEPSSSNTKLDAINNEINEYLSRNIPLSEEFNILDWWEANKDIFPLLYKVSCKILGTPASVAQSEKAILRALNIIGSNPDAGGHADDMINELIFLNYNSKYHD